MVRNEALNRKFHVASNMGYKPKKRAGKQVNGFLKIQRMKKSVE